MQPFDVVVVGAGPAGLTAAIYLSRFRRRVLVLDGGAPRASWIPTSHNMPGFPEGVGGPEILERLRGQATRYGAEIRSARAARIEPASDGFALGLEDGTGVQARCALMATGLIDRKPALDHLDAAIHRGVVRICPICDAFEAVDKRIAVLGDGDLGAREALFLRTYSERVTLLHLGDPGAFPQRAALEAAGVEVLGIDLDDIRLGAQTVAAAPPNGGSRLFDHLYLALGCDLQSGLAAAWGAAHDDQNNLVVDAHQATSIAGLYAAGDVVRGLNQIAVATGEAAIAATAIHNRLRGQPA